MLMTNVLISRLALLGFSGLADGSSVTISSTDGFTTTMSVKRRYAERGATSSVLVHALVA
jgi:hypothetical protein